MVLSSAMRIVGHGIDAVDIDRIATMIADHQDRFLERCFTAEERGHGMVGDRPGRRYAEHIAARFAAKEAGMKALGTGLADGIGWLEFAVRSRASGAPELVVTGRAAEVARELGIERWHISLTHTDRVAMASVIAEGL